MLMINVDAVMMSLLQSGNVVYVKRGKKQLLEVGGKLVARRGFTRVTVIVKTAQEAAADGSVQYTLARTSR